MAIDTGTAAVVGSVLLLAGTFLTTRSADRRGKKDAEQQQASKQHVVEEVRETSFQDNLALTQYIRQQVREGVQAETEQLRADREQDRRELNDVKRILGNVYGRLERIRQAVREYISQVREQWGKAENPPPINGHLSELLDDVDEDTWTRVRMQELTASNDDRPGTAEQ